MTSDEYVLRVATDTMIYVLLALGLNVAVGWAGILDLGYIAFYGFAAYLFAELSSPHYGIHWPLWASLPVVLLATVVLGLLLALPSRRLTGDYLAIVTLFFGQIFITLTTQGYRWNWFGFGGEHNITGGRNRNHAGGPIPDLRSPAHRGTGLPVGDPCRLRRRRGRAHVREPFSYGRAWRSLRDDSLAAEVMSMPVNRLMLIAVAVGAGVAGLAGAINGAYYQGVFRILRFSRADHGLRDGDPRRCRKLAGVVAGAVILNVLLEVLRTPEHSRWVFYGLVIAGLIVKIRPWRLLAGVVGGLVVFGVAVNLIVGAVWPRGTAGPVSTGVAEFTKHGWFAEALRHWLVLPAHTYEVADYQIGNVAFVTLIALVLTLTVVRGWWRYVLLVPTIWTAAFVWETRLVKRRR